MRPYPRRIADDFPGVPYPIDTVFFNIAEELLYFFKDTKVIIEIVKLIIEFV